MNVTRICLLGLPRCGSQYISNVIAKSVGPNMQNLGEPFTAGHPYNIIQKNNLLYPTTSDFTKYTSLTEQINYVFSLLKNSNQEQSLVLKLFLNNRVFTFLSEILNELSALNFKFLIMKRENTEYQLVSWLVATATNKFDSTHGMHDKPIFINNDLCHDVIGLYESILNFDKVLAEYKIEADCIRYEHAVLDLTMHFQKKMNIDIARKKQLPNNPYDMIENADEVRKYLNILMSRKEQ